eukprot:5519072-Alexandrium_andersonii.AAC.1
MSASLVGSEMCIRDRCCSLQLRPWGAWRRDAEGAARTPPAPGLGRGRRCLLYTSDAADDM